MSDNAAPNNGCLSRRELLAAGAASGLSLLARPSSADEGGPLDVRIQTERPRQTMEHFGASGCWSLDPIGAAWNDEERERLAELLFSREKGAGLSLFRFNLGAGDPNPQGYGHSWRRVECLQNGPGKPIDGTRQAGQQWFLRAAKRHGVERTLAFTNSPPVWLTRNGRAFCSKNGDSTNLREGAEADFGRFLADVLRYFEKNSLPFDYVSPVNEPGWEWTGGQEGCRYANPDIARLLPVVAATLKQSGVRATLCAPEAEEIKALLDDADFRAYRGAAGRPGEVYGGNNVPPSRKKREMIHDLVGDPACRAAMDGRLLVHSYWSDRSPHDLRDLRQIARKNLDRYAPGFVYWQSEYCVMEGKRDLGIDTALRVARVIHADLTHAEASSWSWWLAVSPSDYKDGLVYTDFGPGGGPHNILPSKILWALGHWSRWVRPGARRVESTVVGGEGGANDLLASAFVDASGRRVTVVLVNPATSERTVNLSADHRISWKTCHVTDAARDLAPAADALPTGGANQIALPARSILTLGGNVA